jgi:rare lipoprotein A
MLRERSRHARVLAGLALATVCAVSIGCQSAPPASEPRIEAPTPAPPTAGTATTPTATATSLPALTATPTTAPPPTATATTMPTLAPSPAPTVAPEPVLFETGVASTYGQGDGFEGKRTACGQIFRTGVVQVAHKTLPCGTRLLIEDVASGNAVEASVTDRGPYIPGRVVDLSWAAFRQLDPRGPGLLHVKVYLVQAN